MTRTSIDMLYFDRPEYHLTIDNVLARAKSVRMAEYLVKHGANINQGTGVFFETLLWNAAMAGDFELVKFCVQNGANINQEYCGWMGEGMVSTTALEAACSKPDKLNTSDGVCSNPEYMKIIKFLVAHGALINRPYSYENSALTRAVRAKNKEVVRFLLKHGATINTQTILERPITQAEIDQLR
jgi:ankyrin repeat protein